ncbi:hypothetical protein ACWCYL_12170 [Streptomyces sp. 900105755]
MAATDESMTARTATDARRKRRPLPLPLPLPLTLPLPLPRLLLRPLLSGACR